MPGPWSATVNSSMPPRRPELHFHRGARRSMRGGIGCQLHQCLRQALRIENCRAGRGTGQQPRPVGEQSRLGEHRAGEGSDIDRLAAQEIWPLAAGQTVSSSTSLLIRASSSAAIASVSASSWVAGSSVSRLPCTDGDRRAQFMPGVGEETPLRCRAASSRSSMRLKVLASSVISLCPRTGYPAGDVGLSDLPRQVGRVADRPEHAAGCWPERAVPATASPPVSSCSWVTRLMVASPGRSSTAATNVPRTGSPGIRAGTTVYRIGPIARLAAPSVFWPRASPR